MRIAGPSRNIRSARPLCGDDGAAEESQFYHIIDPTCVHNETTHLPAMLTRHKLYDLL